MNENCNIFTVNSITSKCKKFNSLTIQNTVLRRCELLYIFPKLQEKIRNIIKYKNYESKTFNKHYTHPECKSKVHNFYTSNFFNYM